MSSGPADVHLFGIRHHGPGSARALRDALAALQPDVVLVEGPPDADHLIHWLAHGEMQPPVALLVYRPNAPQQAATYPFAVFSPEYQALHYGATRGIPTRFCDLPQANRLGLAVKPHMPDVEPLAQVARAAGYPGYEAWWNALIEQRQSTTALFESVRLLMTALRAESVDARADSADAVDAPAPPGDAPDAAARRLAEQREAYMRHDIRRARAAGHRRIAVVVGAWHVPALADVDAAGQESADTDLLADLTTVDVAAAWMPWTYGRLALAGGYGAGILSPGWYHHLWEMGLAGADPATIGVHWLARIARLLREQGHSATPAHIIEAARLAEALAALRDKPLPGLAELGEAARTVICFGDDALLEPIGKQLIVSERMGQVPDGVPMTPLQRDLRRELKQLRLRPDAERSTLTLDLRTPLHLARSHLLHRLTLLEVGWGQIVPQRSQQGTYRELWRLLWLPEHTLRVIERSIWGNTVAEASAAYARDRADRTRTLPDLTALLDQIILAELPETIAHVMARVDDEAALSSDIPHMMGALPPLARVLRYGNVRQTDRGMVQHVVDSLLTRIVVGLPSTCAALDDDASAELFTQLATTHAVVATLQDPDHHAQWTGVLRTIADQPSAHNLLAGKACRLLFDGRHFDAADVARRLGRALSPPTSDAQSADYLLQQAFWVEGFLTGSGLMLIHDRRLWQLLDDWVQTLPPDRFESVLPLLRRTFASFNRTLRQQMLDRVRAGSRPETGSADSAAFDARRANAVLPQAARLLGVGL